MCGRVKHKLTNLHHHVICRIVRLLYTLWHRAAVPALAIWSVLLLTMARVGATITPVRLSIE